jgi:aminopeptidase N
MLNNTNAPIYLKDYTPPPYRIHKTSLVFELGEEFCLVHHESEFKLQSGKELVPLNLSGKKLELVSLLCDGVPVPKDKYELAAEELTFQPDKPEFKLKMTTKIYPHLNTALEGLYKSGGKFCTQCEAEGFRRITFFIDRPDNLSVFETTIIADRRHYPVLLSNGNLIEKGSLEGEKHFAKWHDPYPKPSYLFALVAGDLISADDIHVTKEGRRVKLQVFTEAENKDKCSFALDALKRSMKWDEDVYGLNYDLDIYMIVAVGDFNMGAMENKGLNIFNSKFVLADNQTATDDDFMRIDGIISHEYFHNWTGNRVTLRDWFQLSLKEGLTVFRDQQFSADMTSHTVKRITDVRTLRERQFTEDAGTMAHPVRPESYIEINNFYTPTVYEKGAEVIRMLSGILGEKQYYEGIARYIKNNDGRAATIEDFTNAMFASSAIDLSQFKLWYSQPGTPMLTLKGVYHPQAQTFTVTVKQTLPDTPATKTKHPMLIPVKTALFDAATGSQLPLWFDGETKAAGDKDVTLLVREHEQTFVFNKVAVKPIASYLRHFSAPIKLETDHSQDDLLFLMAHDSDGFNRYEAYQKLATRLILDKVKTPEKEGVRADEERFLGAFGSLLRNRSIDPLLLANMLILPSVRYVMTLHDGLDLDAVYAARSNLIDCIVEAFSDDLVNLYKTNRSCSAYEFNQSNVGRRSLQNIALWYLCRKRSDAVLQLCREQYEKSDNMTDTFGALQAVNDLDVSLRHELLNDFFQKWQHDKLVVNKWFALQAASSHKDNLEHIRGFLSHPKFDIKNPNNMYALFSVANFTPFGLHKASGEGYRLIADYVIKLNGINTAVASRLANIFSQKRLFDASRQKMMKEMVAKILATPDLAKDVYEICAKSMES